ncbi:hypothetical protein [Paenibacillus sp. MBLB4367]
MVDQDDRVPEDPLSVGKGIAYGIFFGSILWAALIGAFWLILK